MVVRQLPFKQGVKTTWRSTILDVDNNNPDFCLASPTLVRGLVKVRSKRADRQATNYIWVRSRRTAVDQLDHAIPGLFDTEDRRLDETIANEDNCNSASHTLDPRGTTDYMTLLHNRCTMSDLLSHSTPQNLNKLHQLLFEKMNMRFSTDLLLRKPRS